MVQKWKFHSRGAGVRSVAVSAEHVVLRLVVLSTADNKGGEGKVCRDKGLKLVPLESYSNTNSNTNPVLPDPLFCQGI